MNFDLSIENASAKLSQLDNLIKRCNESKELPSYFPIIIKMIQSLESIISISVKNHDFLNNELILDDFLKVLHAIETILDILPQYLHYIANSPKDNNQIICYIITDLNDCVKVFSSNFQQSRPI